MSDDLGRNLGEDGGSDMADVPANSCSRVGCFGTSGVYVCNDQDVAISIPMDEIVENEPYMGLACHRGNGGQPVSGQMFVSDHGGYNINDAVCKRRDCDRS